MEKKDEKPVKWEWYSYKYRRSRRDGKASCIAKLCGGHSTTSHINVTVRFRAEKPSKVLQEACSKERTTDELISFFHSLNGEEK